MNQKDRKNLQFILSMNDQDFEQWVQELPLDDVDYALGLLRKHRQELSEAQIELELTIDEVSLQQAQEVLQRIRRM